MQGESNPRLVFIGGPVRESTFALPGGEMPVGRDASNLLSIADPSVSRRHCVLIRDEHGFMIRDLNSRNGTLVNGTPIREHYLAHGDQITIGDSICLFLLAEGEETPTLNAPVEFEESSSAFRTISLRPADVLYLQPDKILRDLPATSRLARNLSALLKISRVVHSIRDLDALQAEILGLTFEVAPAERGAILLDGHNAGHFSSIFVRNRNADDHRAVRVSRTIASQVVEQGLAILGSNIVSSSSFRGVESLIASQVHSLLCIPLIVFEKVIGCIYLDSTNPAARFEHEHLELVTAIAGISAVALDNARQLDWLLQENQRLHSEINLDHNMVGESERMKDIYRFLSRVAPTDSTILIEGESGTGKELAARAIHRNSPRGDKPFVAINCAALTETLLESELFGHEKGSFTGAIAQKKGKLEIANGGVVFLDEIGELAPVLQSKLLRVIQEREFERVGGTRSIPVDIRLIAATNKNLGDAVKAGGFRGDLYYRLNVVSVTMPALRQRKEDIPLLASYFSKKHALRCKVKPKRLSEDARICLMTYDWPGNVRELENAVERALVLGAAELILPEDLPESVLERATPVGGVGAKYHAAVKELKKQLILSALEQASGSFTDAAKVLGLHPNYLHRLIRNLDLRAEVKVAGKKAG
ncbi:MAG: sigma 54-interacting transcriptional regulator [Acidobacteria bacterium]|nr:sigma 54-interacting transcriptional regulator [Acidobacteriota bacterium]